MTFSSVPSARSFARTRNARLRIGIFATLILQSIPICSDVRAANADRDLKQSVGQMIIAGFFGTSVLDPNFDRLIYDLEQNLVGGVIFLARNITSRSEMEAMLERIKRCNCSAPPFLAIDEEGGVIERLGGKFGYQHTPSAAEMAKSSKAKTKYEYRKLAQRLSDIGFNMNLAPVVDVDKNSNNPIIGGLGRSFSSDPITVASYAAFFIQEHRKLGVLTSLKHFPGHGSSQQDTHTAIADVADTWRPDELIPFHILIQDRLVDSIMVSHLSNAKVWGGAASQAPSTAISELLRGKLKFDGVIISDDLGMDAVRLSKTPFSEVITSAVRAGVDLVIVGRLPDQEQAFDAGRYANSALVNAIDSGEIDSQSIKRSLDRIAKLKKQIRCCRK